jgi:uncharacterized protein with FMN-binding domain
MKKILLATCVTLVASVAIYAGSSFLFTPRDIVFLPEPVTAPTPASPLDRPPTSLPTSTTAPVAARTEYRDGTYTAEGTYDSPAGTETFGVTLILDNDTVTDASMVVGAEHPAAKKFQTKFASELKQYAIGRKISELSLDKVAGASLTSVGFNNALAAIKTQAAN